MVHVDPIELQVLNKTLGAIAEEMGIVLQRSALSPNIKERRDFSCAIFDAKGRLLAQAAHIPVHLGAMPDAVRAVLRSIALGPGDVAITNDPFAGGTHLPDITLLAPVHRADAGRDEPALFYVAARAHHADVGGSQPGSMSLTRTLEEEGVLISPTRIGKSWDFLSSRLSDLVSVMRSPDEREGDLRAQLAALRRGAVRLASLAQERSPGWISTMSEALMAYGRRFMEDQIAEIPDGEYGFEDFLDDDGVSEVPVALRVRLTINGKRAVVDLTESSSQLSTCLNATRSVTRSAVCYCFFCLLGEGYPVNEGALAPIEIRTAPGTVVDPVPPAPVAAGNVETSQRIVDLVMGALAQALPDRIPAAACGSMNNVAVGGSRHDGSEYTYYETIGGGMGATARVRGMSAIQVHMTNTLNTPVEALEQAYPFRIEEYSIRTGSGGTGRNPGGDGIVRRYLFLEPATVSLLTDRRRVAPWGLEGGGPGKVGRNLLIRADGSVRELPGKCLVHVEPGDRIEIRTPGGGGFGPARG